MKTAKPETRNPDADLAAADIDTSRLDADTNNIGPRLGLAWSPGGKKYVVRGGYGIFYGRTPSIMLGTAHSNNGINILTYTFTGASVPTYPNRFSSIPTGGAAQRPSILVVDKDFQNPRLQQASAGFDYEMMREHVAVGQLPVREGRFAPALDRPQPRAARIGDLHGGGLERDVLVSPLRRGRDAAVRELQPRDRVRERRPNRSTTASRSN